MPLPYSFIVPLLNRGDKLLKQLATFTDESAPRSLLVIDNSAGRDASVAGAIDLLRNHAPHFPALVETAVTVAQTGENLGVAASWNFGMRETPGPWIIANSDIYLCDGGVIATMLTDLDRFDLVLACGMALFGIGASAVEKAGTFDENFWPAYNEDLDYVTRLTLCGGAIHEFAASVDHDGSATMRSDPRVQKVIALTHGMNDGYFRRKWGGKHRNGFKGRHVYGMWSHPYNDQRISPREWVRDELFIKRKQHIFNAIMG
jgi:GT2 family glycosyltransferase